MPSVLVHTGNYNIKLYIYYSITQSIVDNTSTISCYACVNVPSGWDIGPWSDFNGSYVGRLTLTFNGDISHIYSGDHNISPTKSFTVEHNSDGTGSTTIYWKWGVNSSWGGFVNPSGSFNITLPTIPRAPTMDFLTCSTEYLNGTLTYKYTPKKADFYNRLRVSIPNICVLDYEQLGTKPMSQQTGTYTLSSSLLSDIYTRYPSQDFAYIGVVIEAYSDSSYSNKIGESSEKTLKLIFPSSLKPSCTCAITDVAGFYNTYGAYVQNKSVLRIVVTPTLSYGSPIKQYTVNVDGKTYSSSSVTTDRLSSSGTVPVTIQVTDARGRSSAVLTEQINVLEYSPPLITLTAYRCTSLGNRSEDGAYMKLEISGVVASLDNQNTSSYEIRYKKSEDSSWTILSGSGSSFISNVITCDVEKTWNVEGRVTDRITRSPDYKAAVIPISFVLMDFHNSGKGITFGAVANYTGFDCYMDARFRGTFEVDTMPDYIVENGRVRCPHTEAYYDYEIYKSGTMKLYFVYPFSDIEMASSTQGFFSFPHPSCDFPFAFQDLPFCSASILINLGETAPSRISVGNVRYTKGRPEHIYYYVYYASSTKANGQVNLEFTGKLAEESEE